MVHTKGKRKEARARARVKEGKGKVRINSKPLDTFQDEMIRLMIKEPLSLAEELKNEVDIDVEVSGGGKNGQAEATRQAIARGLVEFSEDSDLEEKMEEYDRHMLARDPRTTEPHKPSVSSQGARKHKQRSKR